MRFVAAWVALAVLASAIVALIYSIGAIWPEPGVRRSARAAVQPQSPETRLVAADEPAPSLAFHRHRWAWTESKATRIVLADATARLPAGERAPLERALQKDVQLAWGFVTLRATSEESLYGKQRGDYALYYWDKARSALRKVREGLEIADVECTGVGNSVGDARFRHFRCLVTSMELEIPSIALVKPEKTELVERRPRVIHPLQGRLFVHVTGPSTIVFSQRGP